MLVEHVGLGCLPVGFELVEARRHHIRCVIRIHGIDGIVAGRFGFVIEGAQFGVHASIVRPGTRWSQGRMTLDRDDADVIE
jgi:hypothetical protein